MLLNSTVAIRVTAILSVDSAVSGAGGSAQGFLLSLFGFKVGSLVNGLGESVGRRMAANETGDLEFRANFETFEGDELDNIFGGFASERFFSTSSSFREGGEWSLWF